MPFGKKTKKESFMASGGKCAICHLYPIMNYHHINPEAQSQDDTSDNCLPICSNCHDFIQTGGITQDNQKLIRNSWYENVKWKSTDEERKLLEKNYSDSYVLEKIDKNVGEIKQQFEDYLGVISTHKTPEIVADSASILATSILATGSYYTLLQFDNDETVEGYQCPNCHNLINFQYKNGMTISCPTCGVLFKP